MYDMSQLSHPVKHLRSRNVRDLLLRSLACFALPTFLLSLAELKWMLGEGIQTASDCRQCTATCCFAVWLAPLRLLFYCLRLPLKWMLGEGIQTASGCRHCTTTCCFAVWLTSLRLLFYQGWAILIFLLLNWCQYFMRAFAISIPIPIWANTVLQYQYQYQYEQIQFCNINTNTNMSK